MISELDSYFDAAPRSGAIPVDVGAFTLFVSHTPFGYYARPARTQTDPIVESDLVALEKACAENNVDLSIQWVHEMHPELPGLAVADVSFSFGGTNIGQAGPEERDASVSHLDLALIEHLRERGRSGLTVTAVAESADDTRP